MRTYLLAALVLISAAFALHAKQSTTSPPVLTIDPVPDSYTFLQLKLVEGGETRNEKYFLGRLPQPGESVDMVYVGSTKEGALRFQLRVRP